MKNSKLLLLSAVMLSAFGTVACGEVVETTTPVEDAAAYVFQIYRNPEEQAAQYTLPNKLSMEIGEFSVEWSVKFAEGVSENLVKVVTTPDKTQITPDIVVATSLEVPAAYTLVANVSDAEGNACIREIKKSVPKAPAKTVAEFHNLKKGDYCKLEGVVTAVNKVGKAGSFIITDATGSTFSYSGANVELGKKYTMVGMRDDYSGFAQLANVSIMETTGENQLSSVLSDKITTITVSDVQQICSDYAGAKKEDTVKEYSPKFYKITGGYLVKNGSGFLGIDVTQPTGTVESKVVNIYYNNNSSLDSLVNTAVDLYGAIRGFGTSYLTVQVLYCVPAGQAVTF